MNFILVTKMSLLLLKLAFDTGTPQIASILYWYCFFFLSQASLSFKTRYKYAKVIALWCILNTNSLWLEIIIPLRTSAFSWLNIHGQWRSLHAKDTIQLNFFSQRYAFMTTARKSLSHRLIHTVENEMCNSHQHISFTQNTFPRYYTRELQQFM